MSKFIFLPELPNNNMLAASSKNKCRLKNIHYHKLLELVVKVNGLNELRKQL